MKRYRMKINFTHVIKVRYQILKHLGLSNTRKMKNHPKLIIVEWHRAVKSLKNAKVTLTKITYETIGISYAQISLLAISTSTNL
jgi:hypothetical protein